MEKILYSRSLNNKSVLNMKIQLTPKERIKQLRFPKEINKELAYFCGVLAGDGSIGFNQKKKDYWIKCVGNPADEKEFYNELIEPMIKQLFNLEILPKSFDKDTTYGFNINSKSLVKYLTEFIGLPLGKKYDKLKIPDIFLDSNELTNSFICGVADTDFHLAVRKGYYPVISGVSKSERFIRDLREFLEKQGFKCCMYKRDDNDKRFNKPAITYRLELSGYNQFLRWTNLIGFKHPKNQDKIKLLIELANKKNSGGGI
ncbi:MAG: hypothetical protein NC820_07895 [Candidatus Omnitrophica bacterium]|nr:hypothetical protein [Candidatus Omnitrophota bacterium]